VVLYETAYAFMNLGDDM